MIATHAIRIKRPGAAPTGIDWTSRALRRNRTGYSPTMGYPLNAEDLEEMPILAELKRMTPSNA